MNPSCRRASSVLCSVSTWGNIWSTASCSTGWSTRPSPRPNESQVSLNADSGDNETNFHFKVSGSSGGVDMWRRDYRRACRENEWSVCVNIVPCSRPKYRQCVASVHGARSIDLIQQHVLTTRLKSTFGHCIRTSIAPVAAHHARPFHWSTSA